MLKLLVALKQRLLYAALAPILERHERLIQRQEEIQQLNDRAMERITSAIKECAEQLANHTEAVKGMASASQELRETVRQINRMLGQANPDGAKTKHPGYLVHRLK